MCPGQRPPCTQGKCGLIRRGSRPLPPRTSAYASLSAASPGARTTGCWPPAITLQHMSIPISSLWASISLIGRNLKSHRKNGFLSSLERRATAWMDLVFRLAGGSAAHLAWDGVPRWLMAPRQHCPQAMGREASAAVMGGGSLENPGAGQVGDTDMPSPHPSLLAPLYPNTPLNVCRSGASSAWPDSSSREPGLPPL